MKTRSKLTVFAITASAVCQGLWAQTPGASPADAAEQEEIITLSPFEVTAEEDVGYLATQTLAGTRIRTDLADVGSAISVVTREFLNDVGATDNSTLLQYTVSAEVAGTRGTFTGLGTGSTVDETSTLRAPNTGQRVRGLAAADTTRDFYVTDIPWDSFNVDRVDIQRGPNAILFGLGSPAGIINASTRNAEFRNLGSVEARFGSYGSVRGSVDINQVLIPRVLAIRFDGLWSDEKFQQDPAFQEDKRLYGAVRFEPQLFGRDFRTIINAKYEHGEIDANRPRVVPPNDAITPWFREMPGTPDGWMLQHGMNKTPVNNGYDANRNDANNIIPGNGLGLQTRNFTNPNYQPWLTAPVNQQQPFWLLDGATGQTYRIVGGYINPGARLPSGATRSASDGLYGRRYADQFFGLNTLNTYATNANLPLSGSGQYRAASLTDPTVFNFYDELIDGPNKEEFEKWDAYNIDFTQTAYGDRLGLQVTYDRQRYRRGGEGLLGTTRDYAQPTITLDILQNFQDYYLTTNDPVGAVTNPNFGRPYVTSAAGGTGNSYESDREYTRASLFGELRTSDLLENEFLVKLLGKHRLNGVYSKEDFYTEDKGWQRTATPLDWDAYWNGNSGQNSSFRDRPPMGFIYLGSSVAARDSAAGANIPRISSQLDLQDGNAYVFDSTWTNFGVPFDAPWQIPNQFTAGRDQGIIFDPTSPPGGLATWTQASNPANYQGWGFFPMNLMRYNDGQNDALLFRAAKALRQTTSWAGSYQGFFWNDAIVLTLGWRYDEVKGKDITAPTVPNARSTLNLQPSVYRLPDEFPQSQIFKDHSTSGGIVVHLNKLLERDPLPINVSVSYNKSNNFQVTNTRRDVYGNPIANPTGSTKDYGVTLSTKDNKYIFRAVKYETSISGSSAGLSDPGGIGRTIQQGLRFRNVFLYDLSVYNWDTREQPASRNTWGGLPGTYTGYNAADSTITAEEGRRREDAAITTWNEIQAFVAERGFFEAWGFTPVALDKLTTRSAYEATLVGRDPAAQFMPDTNNVNAYVATQPQGFTVTADTVSEGYEFEFTANPLPNWRLTFNASQTEAVRNNVGGAVMDELVDFMDSKLYNADGTASFAGAMPQFGNTGLSINANVYNAWRGNYAQFKLQEGSAVPEIREWRYNLVTNYTFTDGMLEGVGVGGSYRWQDEVVIGYPVIEENNRFSFDLSRPYFGPAEDAIDLWVSYERKLTSKINWRIQLNVRNAFADEGIIPVSIQPDGQTWATVRVKPVQEWFVTNTFSF